MTENTETTAAGRTSVSPDKTGGRRAAHHTGTADGRRTAVGKRTADNNGTAMGDSRTAGNGQTIGSSRAADNGRTTDDKGSAYEKITYEKMLLDLLSPLKNRFSPMKTRLELGAETAGYGNRIAGMEGYLRLLWGLVPYWKGGGADESLLPVYLEGLANGTDPASPEYWGALHNKDQRMVEMASLSYGLLLLRDKLWEPLPEAVKGNLTDWLGQINLYTQAENNWQYFLVLVNLALRHVGRPWNRERTEAAMAEYESYYLGNGWYSDGLRPQKDYYVSFAIHYYCLLYAYVCKEEDPERSSLFRERAREFAGSFIYWFDEEGKALPFGRSLTYRFAQTAFFSMCAMTGLDCFPIGVLKGIIDRHLRYWLSQPIFDSGGALTIGYGYPNLNMSEGYNASGSPYWALKAFAFLALPEDHPFWKAAPEPLPKGKERFLIPECNMLLIRRGREVTALTSGQYPVLMLTHRAEKYAKFAYSSRFGFCVPRSYLTLEEAAPDSMLAFVTSGSAAGGLASGDPAADYFVLVRRSCMEYSLSEHSLYSRWSPCRGIEVETWLFPTENGHLRRHHITSAFACRAYDCGFSYPDCMERTESREEEHSALIEDKNGWSRVYSENGAGKVIHAAPNTNLIFPLVRIPAAAYEIPAGEIWLQSLVEAKFADISIKIGKGYGYEVCSQ